MLKILVVDDDWFVLDLVTKHLTKKLPAYVTIAASVGEAIDLYENGGYFDVVVSDYRMTDGSGADLLRYIYSKNIFALFVLFTSTIDPELPQTNGHFLGVVEKLNLNDLTEVIAQGVCFTPSFYKNKK